MSSLSICYKSSISSRYLKSTLFLVPVSDLTDKMKSAIHTNPYFALVDFCFSCDNNDGVYKKMPFNLVKKLYDIFERYYPVTSKVRVHSRVRIYVNSFFATNIEEEIREKVLVNIKDKEVEEELLKKIVKWVREEMA